MIQSGCTGRAWPDLSLQIPLGLSVEQTLHWNCDHQMLRMSVWPALRQKSRGGLEVILRSCDLPWERDLSSYAYRRERISLKNKKSKGGAWAGTGKEKGRERELPFWGLKYPNIQKTIVLNLIESCFKNQGKMTKYLNKTCTYGFCCLV